jgi:CHASE2 domain-containing sensor protein/predicted Ser/Thr protein kinase
MKIPKFVTSYWFIGITITVVFLMLFLWGFRPLAYLENRAYDCLSRIGADSSRSPVVIVAVDDKSINDLGPWPWPRRYFSDMVTLLSGSGARLIGLHVPFSQKDPNPGLREMRKIRKDLAGNKKLLKYRAIAGVYRSLRAAEMKADHDRRLISSVKSSKRVILPLLMTLEGFPGKKESSYPVYLKRNSTLLGDQSSKSDSVKFVLKNPLALSRYEPIEVSGIIPPFDALAAQAIALGFSNYFPDRDGIVRDVPLFVTYNNRSYPSFALQVALKYNGLDEKYVTFTKEKQGFLGLKAQSLMIPTDSRYTMFISFRSNKAPFTIYSFSDILGKKLHLRSLKKKIVLVGITAQGLERSYRTPYLKDISDVEMTANALNTILSGNYFVRPSWAFLLESFVILAFGTFISVFVPNLRRKVSAVFIGASLIMWGIFSLILLLGFGLWIKAVSSILFCLVSYSAVLLVQFIITYRHGIESEAFESNKMLGLTLQSQGMLDMAFEKFMKCPVNDESRRLLYNLGLDFERKRMLNKAVSVYERILKNGAYKDIEDRINRLKTVSEAALPVSEEYDDDRTMYLQDETTKPTLGRYEVIEELGRGAMGTVYLGKDPKINRNVAIKTLKYGDMEQEHLQEFKVEFFREAEAAGTLSHPNIMTIYDIGEEHDMAYIAMELLKGKDLTEYTQEGNLLSPEKVFRIISSVAEALDYAHENGVVHRDIKPANIMLLEDDTVKVADFGIATIKASTEQSDKTATIIGTPNYMSPEQITGKDVDGRTDFFSLGCVTYELLSGEKPFKADSMAALTKSITQGRHKPITKLVPLLAPCCKKIVDKLLAKSVSRRYQKGKDIVEDIQECLKEID